MQQNFVLANKTKESDRDMYNTPAEDYWNKKKQE